MKDHYYLDANAHITMSQMAQKAYLNYINSPQGNGNPSAPSSISLESARLIEKARGNIASQLGTDYKNIYFTTSATQAAEWGIDIFMKLNGGEGKISMYPIEHAAVLDALSTKSKDYTLIPVDQNGVIKNHSGEKVICIHSQSELGVIQPLETIEKTYLFSDLTQSIGKLPINLSEMPVDIGIFSAHKFGGPVGVGILYLKDPNWWRPYGSGSRYSLDRPGTANVAGVIATNSALKEALDTLNKRSKNMLAFKTILEKGLEDLNIEILAKEANRLNNTTFIKVPNKAYQLLFQLSEKNIYTGLGSACGSMHAGPTALAKVLGIEGTTHDFIRISQWGQYDGADAEYIVQTIKSFI